MLGNRTTNNMENDEWYLVEAGTAVLGADNTQLQGVTHKLSHIIELDMLHVHR